MTVVKSFSVGQGDRFYINHPSDCFTLIDCCLTDDRASDIISELRNIAAGKTIVRFISTHPDDDHLRGLTTLTSEIDVPNFYCVQNAATKEDETDDFVEYCHLRDSDKAFFLRKGVKRRWLNDGDDRRSGSGIRVLWPDPSNEDFKQVVADTENGGNPNNLSPILSYSVAQGASILWMGDLEASFTHVIRDAVTLTQTDILFAPHHGRATGKVPSEWLDAIQPRVVIIGEAPSKDLDYYPGYNTITQNSAGDIRLDCHAGKVDFYVGNSEYAVEFLENEGQGANYLGTLRLPRVARSAHNMELKLSCRTSCI